MKKRVREDVVDNMRRLIDGFKAATGNLPPHITLTENDYDLLCTTKPGTRERVRPLVFEGVTIRIV